MHPAVPSPESPPAGWYRRHRTALLLAVATAALAAGCDDHSPTGTGGGDEAAAIRGTVTRQKTGQGVEGVTFTVLRAGRPVVAATSGPDGSFSVPGLADGTYEVVPTGLELAGVDPLYDAVEPARDTAVVAGGSGEALVFAVLGLVPGRISGTVTCGGEPDPTAEVRVAGGTGTDRTATPDAIGRYAVLELEAGVYAVVPGSSHCTLTPSLRIVDVRPGEFVRVDFAG